MLSGLLAFVGLTLVSLAMLDALWTTLGTGGGGPLTTRLSQGIWRVMLLIHRRCGQQCHRLLLITGTVILLLVIVTWILLLWTGWTLLFSAETSAVVHGQTHEPAGGASRIYFTGYTLFTLGIGNYVPQGGLWEVLTALASLNGLFLITLAITYLVPVVSAAAQKRQLAAVISDLGGTPVEIVRRAWDGEDFSGIETPLAQLVPMIELHAQRHLAYPVLHYFHSPHRRTAVSPSLAALDEALLLLTEAIEPQARLPEASTVPVQQALAGLLATLHQQYIRAAKSAPPMPGFDKLQDAGLPLIAEPRFRQAVAEQAPHRALLRAFVEDDGWTWDEVMKASPLAMKRPPAEVFA